MTSSLEKFKRTSTKDKVKEKVVAKPIIGKPIGTVKFTFKYFEGTAIELGGMTSDVSGLFVSDKAQKDFKNEILNQAKSLGVDIDAVETAPTMNLSTPPQPELNGGEEPVDVDLEDGIDDAESSAIRLAVQDLKVINFAKCCRVLLLDQGGQKHLIVQIRRLKFLTEYAHNIDTAQWSYLHGLSYEYLIGGRASSLPYPKKLWELGKVYVHIFIPENDSKDGKDDQNYLDKMKNLGPIIPMIAQTGNINEVLKAKDDEIASVSEALKKIREDFAEKATTNEAAKTAVAGLEGNGELPESIRKSLGASAYIFVIAPSLLIGYFVNSIAAPYGWIAGIALGVPIGFGLISWRK